MQIKSSTIDSYSVAINRMNDFAKKTPGFSDKVEGPPSPADLTTYNTLQKEVEQAQNLFQKEFKQETDKAFKGW